MSAKRVDGAHHFSGDELRLVADSESGARFWSVALRHTQLTYFEVGAHCRFAAHSHPSEQITLVLEGELFFEIAGDVVRIGAGEVMAIPASVRHAVHTKNGSSREREVRA